jgi:hypothetical protein
MMKNGVLVLCGILLGCAAQSAIGSSRLGTARAAGPVDQYCTSTGDYNDVGKLDSLVKQAGQSGWALVGVYRPAAVGATLEDYACFRRE